MVPLGSAHKSGAWRWTYQRREDYANSMEHPEHLIAVKASANRLRGKGLETAFRELLVRVCNELGGD